jgi:hypothetical protein
VQSWDVESLKKCVKILKEKLGIGAVVGFEVVVG